MKIKKTSLNKLHQDNKAKFVEFAGYEMPIQYSKGIVEEHKFTRSHSGIFDVSHMGQIRLSGEGVKAALESLVPVDIIDLPLMKLRYALFTNKDGGVMDDLMVTNLGGDFESSFQSYREGVAGAEGGKTGGGCGCN